MPGRTDINVGDLWVWTERTTWNPVGGFGDAYSNDIWRNMVDPAVTNDPFTGFIEPFRATYTVETAGPDGDPGRARGRRHLGRRERTPGSRSRPAPRPSAPSPTTSRSTSACTWHDGQPITLADAFYSIAQGFDLAYDPDKSRVEVALAATSRPFLETIKGYRINDDDTVTVYVDYWHFDENMIAGYASPASFAMPWELLAAMDDLVFEQRRAAYSDTAASRQNVPWLSLVMTRDAQARGPDPARAGPQEDDPGRLLPGRRPDAGHRGGGGRPLRRGPGVLRRARPLRDQQSGPYVLERYDPAAQYAELSAFRDPSYPFTAADFQLGEPPTLAIADPEVDPIGDGRRTHRSRSPWRARARSPCATCWWIRRRPGGRPAVTRRPGADAGHLHRGHRRGRHGHAVPGPLPAVPGRQRATRSALVTERQVDLEVTP